MGEIKTKKYISLDNEKRKNLKEGLEDLIRLIEEVGEVIPGEGQNPGEFFSVSLKGYLEEIDRGTLSHQGLREIVAIARAVDQVVKKMAEEAHQADPGGDTTPSDFPTRVHLQFSSQEPKSLSSFALSELAQIRKAPKPGRIPLPKDLMDTQVNTRGETLEYITDPKTLNDIKALQAKGQLLAGTLEGLSRGGGFLKSFTIVLAQTLNEQSKYYQTEGDLSGVKGLIEEKFGKEVQIIADSRLPRKGGQPEDRTRPYILVSYEDLASKIKGKGKKRGGKDAEFIREYIDKLSGKQYLLDGGTDSRGRRILTGVPFLIRLQYFYLGGKEVGCLLCLSPQFSKTLRGYTSLRADTIQRIGGGQQKDITMALLDRLLYVRGTDKGNKWEKNKEALLSDIATGTAYKGRPGRREKDFRVAIQKVKDSGLIINYKERTTPQGDTISVFTFNPNYYKDTPGDPEEQGV